MPDTGPTRKACEALGEPQVPTLYRLAFRLVRSQADAAALVQKPVGKRFELFTRCSWAVMARPG